MTRFRLFLTALAIGLLFALAVPLSALDRMLPSLLIALAIVVAALLLRAGPTLDADLRGLDPVRRCRLTRRLVERSQSCVRLIALFCITMAGLLVLTAAGAERVALLLSPGHEKMMAGLIGSALGLCLAAVPEIARRDLDLLRLQKRLIDPPGQPAAIRRDNVVLLRRGQPSGSAGL